MMSGNLPKDN